MASKLYLLPVTAYLAALFLGACNEGALPQGSGAQPRPVKVLKLAERDFRRESSLTGSVSLYRQQRVGFKVSGRILSGPAADKAGAPIAIPRCIRHREFCGLGNSCSLANKRT